MPSQEIQTPKFVPTPVNPEPAAADGSNLEDLRQALIRSDTRYAALMERAGYGVYRSSAEGRLVDANCALATILGHRGPSDLLGLDLSRDIYVDPDERERLLKRATGSGFPDWVETRWKRRDGSLIMVRLSVRPITDLAGRV